VSDGQPTAKDSDPVLAALDDIVRAVEQNSQRNQQMLERAEEIRRMRREGRPYREVVPAAARPLIVELTRQNLEALHQAGSRLRRSEARALHDEGMSMEAIAELFGVTRQRVSALLRGTDKESTT